MMLTPTLNQITKKTRVKILLVVSDLQHELHADPVFYQPHHQVGLTLKHLVVLPGQCVGVLNREVKVGSWTGEKSIWLVCDTVMVQRITLNITNK